MSIHKFNVKINEAELATALELLCAQSYFSEYAVRLGLSVSGQSERIVVALKGAGWDGDILHHATECGDEGWVHSCFDPAELTLALVDELVRDEANSQRRSQP